MTHQLKKLDQFQKELSVELTKEELQAYVDRAEHILGQSLEVDGFRKGKLPKEQARKHLDPKAVLESAMDFAVRESLARVLKEEGLDIVNFSRLEIKENTPEKMVYKVLLTLFPDVKIGELAGIKVARKDVAVEEKEIDETLNSIKSSRASYTDKDGPAGNGDKIEIDFEIKDGDKLIDGGISKNHPMILGDKHFMPGFEENILGMKKEEEKTFSLVAPADYYRKDMAGKKLDFKVRMNNVQSVRLPELNDDFVKTLGKFNSPSELIDSVKDGLLQEKKMKEQQRVRLEILNSIIKTSEIPAPDFMVAKQLDSMLQDFDSNLHANGMELGLYLAHIGKTQDELKKDWKGEAEKQVKIFLILHSIARDKNISASHEEIDEELNGVVQSIVMRGGTIQENLNVERLKEDIASKITNEKTLSLLEKLCTA